MKYEMVNVLDPQCRTCGNIDTDGEVFFALTCKDIGKHIHEDICVNAMKVRDGWPQGEKWRK